MTASVTVITADSFFSALVEARSVFLGGSR